MGSPGADLQAHLNPSENASEGGVRRGASPSAFKNPSRRMSFREPAASRRRGTGSAREVRKNGLTNGERRRKAEKRERAEGEGEGRRRRRRRRERKGKEGRGRREKQTKIKIYREKRAKSPILHIEAKPIKCPDCTEGFVLKSGVWTKCPRCDGTGLTYEKDVGALCVNPIGGCDKCPFYDDCASEGEIILEAFDILDGESGTRRR